MTEPDKLNSREWVIIHLLNQKSQKLFYSQLMQSNDPYGPYDMIKSNKLERGDSLY